MLISILEAYKKENMILIYCGATKYNDDHGQTFTVTCAYQLYPMTKWYGTIEREDSDTSD